VLKFLSVKNSCFPARILENLKSMIKLVDKAGDIEIEKVISEGDAVKSKAFLRKIIFNEY